ncbi:MAG: DNA-directed polymerase subunit omega [Candidatus Atribacteria bacterium]|nr:DNA-directed polymerase subunit omega [Candidatus Atribacteria bacterium]
MLPIDEMLKKAGNRYILSLIIAKRTRQLNEGANPLVELEEKHKPLFVALQEFLEDKIQFEFVEE